MSYADYFDETFKNEAATPNIHEFVSLTQWKQGYLSLLFNKFKEGKQKEFLATFDFEKYCSNIDEQSNENKKYNYGWIEDNISYDVADVLSKIANIKDFIFNRITTDLSKIENGTWDDIKDSLKEYANLYKETFKNDLKKTEEGRQINKIFDELLGKDGSPGKIEQAGNDPGIIATWGRFVLYFIPTVCTLSVLVFLNKEAKRTVLHPIQAAKLAQIKNAYKDAIEQTQKLQKKIKPSQEIE